MSQFISVRAAAERLSIGQTTMRRLIREEAVPACLIGGSIRISLAALDEWAAARPYRHPDMSATTRKDPRS